MSIGVPVSPKLPACQPGEIVPGAALVKISSRKVFDAALMRDFPIERFNIQARWEVFNVTNTLSLDSRAQCH